jgi:hypothetical protein
MGGHYIFLGLAHAYEWDKHTKRQKWLHFGKESFAHNIEMVKKLQA